MRNIHVQLFSILATTALIVDVCCGLERQSLVIGRRVKGDKLLQSEILAGSKNIDGLTRTFLGDNLAKITGISVMNSESMSSANCAIISGGPDFTYVTLQFRIRTAVLDPEFEVYVKIYGIDKGPEAQNNIPIFRHGDRTPAVKALFPNDPYYHSDFYPYGLGGLTNAGKVRAYKLGEFLRDRYKNFLGDVYVPERLYARTSEYDRTIMSLQLVLAALYPPKNVQKWHELLDWQPIPFSYSPRHDDKLIATVHTNEYDLERKEIEKKEDVRERLDNFGGFMLELSNLTGKNISNSLDMKRIYETLLSEKFMNLTLPDWTKEIFPDGKLFEGLLLDYDIITYDNRILNSLIGNLMSEITNNMLAIINHTEKRTPKISLYSGHEFNIVAVLKSLKAHQIHLPQYSSAIIIELIKSDGEYFVKVVYYQGVSSQVIELKIAGCPDLCPFDKYLSTVNSVIQPNDDI